MPKTVNLKRFSTALDARGRVHYNRPFLEFVEALGQIVDSQVEIETCSVGRVKIDTILTGILGVGVVSNMVKLLVRDRETIQEAVRRFRKLVERSGIKKEMRRREFYEKPSEIKRRSRLRAERRSKRSHLLSNT